MTEAAQKAELGENLRWMARSRGITVGLLGGLELLLFRLLRLSKLGEACTVILCWKSVRCEKKEELGFHGFKLFSQPCL